MLRSHNQKKSPFVTETAFRASASPRNALAMSGLNFEELTEAILPSMKAIVCEAVIKNIEDQFAKVYTCLDTNLGSINEKLISIGERHDSIQLERISICQSIKYLKTSQEVLEDKIATLKTNGSCSADSLSRVEANFDRMIVANQQLQSEVNALKIREPTDLLSEKLDSLLKEKISNVTLPGTADPLSSEHNEPVSCFSTECRLEGFEQYNRRDCLLFFGLTEGENEECVDKKVQTAFGKAVEIMHDDVSVRHRMHTPNRRSDEPRPIIAKFTRRNSKTCYTNRSIS